MSSSPASRAHSALDSFLRSDRVKVGASRSEPLSDIRRAYWYYRGQVDNAKQNTDINLVGMLSERGFRITETRRCVLRGKRRFCRFVDGLSLSSANGCPHGNPATCTACVPFHVLRHHPAVCRVCAKVRASRGRRCAGCRTAAGKVDTHVHEFVEAHNIVEGRVVELKGRFDAWLAPDAPGFTRREFTQVLRALGVISATRSGLVWRRK